jgi:hypothetical protein
MDHNQLLSSTAELGLDLLEKNGSFIPFCKAVNEAGEVFIYTEASGTSFSAEEAYQSVLLNVRRDLESRGLKGVALCSESRMRLSDSTENVPTLAVEVHYKGLPARRWHFLYEMDGKQATVVEYYTNDANGGFVRVSQIRYVARTELQNRVMRDFKVL